MPRGASALERKLLKLLDYNPGSYTYDALEDEFKKSPLGKHIKKRIQSVCKTFDSMDFEIMKKALHLAKDMWPVVVAKDFE